MKRDPELYIRKLENLSMVRTQGIFKRKVATFFEILKEQLDKVKFDLERVFNVDEIGIFVVQHN